MNKYEQYQMTNTNTTLCTKAMYVSNVGNPVYTREQAIALAAELPGIHRLNDIRDRIAWLNDIPDGYVIEARPSGLVALFPGLYGTQYFRAAGS